MPTLQLEVTEELQHFLARSGHPEQKAVELLEDARTAEAAAFANPANVSRMRGALEEVRGEIERGETANFTAETVIAKARRTLQKRKGA